jgi:hypothetical protein
LQSDLLTLDNIAYKMIASSITVIDGRVKEGCRLPAGDTTQQKLERGRETSCQKWIAVHSWVPLLREAWQLPFLLLRPLWRQGRAAIS